MISAATLAALSAPVFALGVGAGIALVVAGLAVLAVAVFMMLSRKAEAAPAREQRPFHICPGCSAYNAKVERHCWRCNHDLSKSAVEPQGELGLRLEKLDTASKDAEDAAK